MINFLIQNNVDHIFLIFSLLLSQSQKYLEKYVGYLIIFVLNIFEKMIILLNINEYLQNSK